MANPQVKQLIQENLRIENPYLELGNCGLDGTESELALLAECTHLETLIFSNKWDEYDADKQKRVKRQSQNKGVSNRLLQIPPYIAKSIKNLFLIGEVGNNRWEIQDFSFLQGLRNLTSLDLSYNQIQDISFLQGLQNLTSLNLSYNQIKDISFLKNLQHLSYLYLSYNQIQDISFLQGLENLQILCLSGNQIQDISFLQGLKNLQMLNLSANQIQDISFLQGLENLQTLNLSVNQIQDIPFLQGLKQLHTLNLNHNQIQDISPLKQLSQLQELALIGNPHKFPPISLVYLKSQGGQLADYVHLEELPFVDKIWQLMDSDDETNRLLASQLALSQGWTEEQIKLYLKFRF